MEHPTHSRGLDDTPAAEVPQVTHHQPTPLIPRRPEPKKSNKKWIIIAATTLLLVILTIVVVTFSLGKVSGSGIDSSKYQAVFLTNGTQYFGKLQDVNDEVMILRDVYYLANKTNTEGKDEKATTDPADEVELRKRGNDIHNPENSMIIEKRQILFIENLSDDGKVAKAITQSKQN